MNEIQSGQNFSCIDHLSSRLDANLHLSSDLHVNKHTPVSDNVKKGTTINEYLKKLYTIKSSIFENDISQFKAVLRDIETPDEVLKGVSESKSSQIRLIMADLMHDCISMSDREPYIAGLARVFNVNEQNKLGFIPLHLAVARGKLKIVSILIKHGSEIDLKNEQGRTPLHIAVLKGHVEVVHFLLCHGANANLQDRELWTALHWACRNHHLVIIRILLANGARLDLPTHRGRFPLDMAFGANHNPSELVWHPMTAWNLVVHGAQHVSDEIILKWATVLLPELKLSDEYLVVLPQLFLLMCKAGLLSSSLLEHRDVACLLNEHSEESQSLCAKPIRLSQLCRVEMRRLLLVTAKGCSIADRANRLPLPKSLLHFLLLKK